VTPLSIIHIVDDDEEFQVAVSRLLRAAGYDVRNYSNAGDFLLSPIDDAPGCLLLDLQLPGPNGLALQQALATRPDPLPVIFLSGRGDIPSTVRAMKAGAVDFLTKPVGRETLLGTIKNALAQNAERRVVREQLRHWRACFDTLTEREHQVFEGVVAGKLNKQIAGELGAAERTVKAHRAQVMQKMGAASVAELVRIADGLQTGKSVSKTPPASPHVRPGLSAP
jgi:FixJ family two-component response regulator